MDAVNVSIAVFGFAFTIYQFVHQNKKNRETIVAQNEKNWYISVLIIPQINRINDFFDDLVTKIKEKINQTCLKSDLILRAKEQSNSKATIEAFFSPLEAAMGSFDESLRENISNIEMNLQDEVTRIIDDCNIFSSENERKIMEYKANLIKTLYFPIKNKIK